MKNQEFLGCRNCSCAMNAHVLTKFRSTHRIALWKHLNNKQIRDEHIDFGYKVVGFKCSTEVDSSFVWTLSQLLERLGVEVKANRVM